MASCGGVNSRIRDNERLFSSLSPEAQAQIQNGRIAQGFTEDMVYLALGKPDDKARTQSGTKSLVTWKYLRRDPNAGAQASSSLSGPYGFPTFGPGPSQPTPVIYSKRYVKVEFVDGSVVKWDPELQPDR